MDAEIEPRRGLKQRLVLIIFLALLTAIITEKHFVDTPPQVRWDFDTYYQAARAVRFGDGHLLLSTQAADAIRYPWGLPFLYPAATAALFLPLAWLPVVLAYAVWTACNLILLVLSIRILQRRLPIPQNDRPIFVALLFMPVYVCLLHGQLSIFIFFLYAVAFSCFKRGNPFGAGLAVGLAALKFHLIAGFCAILLLRRCWKALAGVTLGGLAVALVSVAVLGWREAARYPAMLLHSVHRAGFDALADNTCARGLLATVFRHDPPIWLLIVLSAGLIAGAAFLRADDDISFSIAVFVSVLVAYHAFLQDLTLTLIPAAVIASRIKQVNRLILVISLSLGTIAGLEYLESVIGGLAHQAAGAATWIIVAFGLWHARRRISSPAAIKPAVA